MDAVSFDIFIQCFENGNPTAPDHAVVLAELALGATSEPIVANDGTLRLETSDGQADVCGVSPGSMSVMFNHVSGISAWMTIWNIANSADAFILPVGFPTIATREGALTHLPPELQQDAVVLTGAFELVQLLN